MKSINPIIFIIAAVILLSACSEKDKEQVTAESKQVKQTVTSETSIGTAESELVRKGIIDVKSIDENNDGNIYECPMDWNVLADQSGDCPLCGMKLKEFTIEEANKNLDTHGYEHK